jgi:glutamate-1-semialdehyde 2,1-aminomutase
VSVAAALAVLRILRDGGDEFYSRLKGKCESVVKPLQKLIHESDLKLQINHVASMFQVFFTQTPVIDYKTVKTADSAKFMGYHAKLLENGVFVPPSQFETCFLSSAHSAGDLEKTVAVLSAVLVQLK